MALDQIGDRIHGRLSLGSAWGFAAADTPQAFRSHQASHPLVSHAYACLCQFGVNPGSAIGAFGFLMEFTDPLAQFLICLCTL
jgi:hypothetical protein